MEVGLCTDKLCSGFTCCLNCTLYVFHYALDVVWIAHVFHYAPDVVWIAHIYVSLCSGCCLNCTYVFHYAPDVVWIAHIYVSLCSGCCLNYTYMCFIMLRMLFELHICVSLCSGCCLNCTYVFHFAATGEKSETLTVEISFILDFPKNGKRRNLF